MNTLKQPQIERSELSEDAVTSYLQSHPDFFERHQSLLTGLKLPHSAGSGAVSLIERQVSVLRQKNLGLERKLKDLVDVARGNDQIATKVHTLALQLLAATGRDGIVEVLENQLRVDFGADEAVLVLFTDDESHTAGSNRFLRLVSREDSVISPFKTFLQADSPRCGQVRDTQRDFLFGTNNIEIGSVALVPVGSGCEIGFLAIGSHDSQRFHPGQSVDLLSRLGELLDGAFRSQR